MANELLKDVMDIARLINYGRKEGHIEVEYMNYFGKFAAKYGLQLQKRNGYGCGSYFTEYRLGVEAQTIYVGTVFNDWNDTVDFMCSSAPIPENEIVEMLLGCINHVYGITDDFMADLHMETFELA